MTLTDHLSALHQLFTSTRFKSRELLVSQGSSLCKHNIKQSVEETNDFQLGQQVAARQVKKFRKLKNNNCELLKIDFEGERREKKSFCTRPKKKVTRGIH